MKKKDFIKVCKVSLSMRQAQKRLNMNRHDFYKLAMKYDCYKTNQGGKGVSKPLGDEFKIFTEDILIGKYPNYQRSHLKRRLLEEGYKKNKCEKCGIINWNNKTIKMELHHRDGNNKNHLLKNLFMLCPNCHSQTPTYCRKK